MTMTIQDQAQLSFYEEIGTLSGRKNICLTRHRNTNELFVKKRLSVYNLSVYRTLQSLNLPYFPHIYCCFEDGDTLILIEEYLNGQNLRDILDNEGPFSEQESVRVGLFLCEALYSLHSLHPKIIHRDIKPSNIIRLQDRSFRLIDFNASREFENSKTFDTVMIGTQGYAPPEQYGFGQSDGRTDIYAVGVTLRMLVSGTCAPNSSYRGGLLPVIQKCTQLQPESRYHDTSELAMALKKRQNPRDRCVADADSRNSCSIIYTGYIGLYRRFLPPGFRSGKWWKMLIASPVYLMSIALFLSLDFNTEDSSYPPAAHWFLRISFLGIFLGVVCFLFDWLGFRSRCKTLNRLRGAVYWIAVVSVCSAAVLFLIVLTILVVLIIPGLSPA